jgi:glycosyltransferase involved in cell wall biosynthesis
VENHDLPTLAYLTVNPMVEGVGASQVVAYVERLAQRGMSVRLHNFEEWPPDADVADRLRTAGVDWRPMPMGRGGPPGGLGRLLRGARALRGAQLAHARSDIAAGAATLARVGPWVWDMRALWTDQRAAAGDLAPDSSGYHAMRRIEGVAARRSHAIVSLTDAAVHVLADRYGAEVAGKATVIATCVDLDRFAHRPMPDLGTVRFLLSGTVNRMYDVPAMLEFVDLFRRCRPAALTGLVAPASPWRDALAEAGAELGFTTPAAMPEQIAGHHVGLAVLRSDLGVSLKAVSPTKVGEFLATGRPVVLSAGIGDISDLIREQRCGVAIDDTTADGLRRSVEELVGLLDDPLLGDRCRALAGQHFSLDLAVDRLTTIYHRILAA